MITITLSRDRWQKIATEIDRIISQHDMGSEYAPRLNPAKSIILQSLAGDRTQAELVEPDGLAIRWQAKEWEYLEWKLYLLGGSHGKAAAEELANQRVNQLVLRM